jgi:hypothetical protein
LLSDNEGEIGSPVEFTMESAKRRLEQIANDLKRVQLKERSLLMLDNTVHIATKMIRILSQPSNHNVLLIGEGIYICREEQRNVELNKNCGALQLAAEKSAPQSLLHLLAA